MKINGNGDAYRIDRPATPASGGAQRNGKAEAPQQDTVRLSGLAEQLARLANEGPAGAYDPARGEAIKAAIQRGEFHVDSGVVADKLLQSVQELIAK